jgi:hypothetical protein
MGYTLEAIIGPAADVRRAVAGQPDAVIVPLHEDLVLVPMTEELFAAFAGPEGGRAVKFETPGTVAYVEAEFFGGIGTQRAEIWTDGTLTFGPLEMAEGETVEVTPISQVLAKLGVKRTGYPDEFDVVRLDRHRDTEGWLSHI